VVSKRGADSCRPKIFESFFATIAGVLVTLVGAGGPAAGSLALGGSIETVIGGGSERVRIPTLWTNKK